MQKTTKKISVFLALIFAVAIVMQGTIVFAKEEERAGEPTSTTEETTKTQEQETEDEQTSQEETTSTQRQVQPEEEEIDLLEEDITPDALNDITTYFDQLGISPASILTGWNITFEDEEGVVEKPTVNAKVLMEFDFEIPDGVSELIREGDYFHSYLPHNIKVSSRLSFPLQDEYGTEYGTVVVNTDGSVVITFTDEAQHRSNIQGSYFISGNFNRDDLSGPGDTTIEIPMEEMLPPVDVTIVPNASTSVEKNGYLSSSFNPKQVTWKVDINKGMETVTNAKVTENFPNGTEFVSVEVYQIKVDFDGVPIEGSETLVSPGAYTVSPDGKMVTIDGEIEDCYRLVYTCDITEDALSEEGGRMTFTNNAEYSSDEFSAIKTSATVTAEYHKAIDKSTDHYDEETQTFRWVIKYNYNERKVPQEYAYVDDTFSDDAMELIRNSFVVRKATFGNNGAEILGDTLEEGVDYDIIPEASGAGFRIQFRYELDFAVKISYETTVNDMVENDYQMINKAVDGRGYSDGSTGNVQQGILIKQIASVNYAEKKITWRIIVNRNNYELNGYSMVDTFSPGLTLVEDSFQMRDAYSIPPTMMSKDTDYSFTNTGDGFELSLINGYDPTNHNFIITYDTTYDMSHPDFDSAFLNSVKATWKDKGGKDHENDDNSTFDPNDEDCNNGAKEGSYNAVTKELSWVIRVDYAQIGLKNAWLEDEIEDRQNFIRDSVRIYRYSIDPGSGVPSRLAELSDAEYDDFTINQPEDPDNTLMIDLPEIEGELYWIEYKTSLDGTMIGQDDGYYHNTAIFHNDNSSDCHLEASVQVTDGKPLARKTGVQDNNGEVWWTVTINPSQSTMSDVKVTDTPSLNQYIDLDSLVLYGANVTEAGAVSINYSDILVQDEDYSLEYSQNESGLWILELKFLSNIDKAFILRYRTDVYLEEGTEPILTNGVKITGNHIETVEGGDEANVQVDVSEGGGIVVGTYGSYVVQKVNSRTGEPLVGAVFQLYNMSGKPIGGEMTTDEDGKITIERIVYGNYLLKEVCAPEGCSIHPTLYEGVTITIDAHSSRAEQVFILENDPSAVALSKVNPDGETLEGASFKIEQMVDGQWIAVREDESFVTDENGVLEIEGLPIGQYRLTEIKAPDGYLIETEPVEFEMIENETGEIIGVAIEQFTNYQGSAELRKVDDEENPLTGVTFKLYNSSGQELMEVLSDENGLVTMPDLAPGGYELMETATLEGYIRHQAPIYFTIPREANGEPISVDLGDLVNVPVDPLLDDSPGDPGGGGLIEDDETVAPITPSGVGGLTARGSVGQVADMVSSKGAKTADNMPVVLVVIAVILGAGTAAGIYIKKRTKRR